MNTSATHEFTNSKKSVVGLLASVTYDTHTHKPIDTRDLAVGVSEVDLTGQDLDELMLLLEDGLVAGPRNVRDAYRKNVQYIAAIRDQYE